MLLKLNNKEDTPKIYKYKKCKGIALVNKYFKELSPLNKMYVVDSLEEWHKVEEEFPKKMMTARCDSLRVVNLALPNGQSFDRSRVEGYIKEVKKVDDEAVIILEDLKKGTNERIQTDGGINIEIKINDYVHIEYVGPGFDCLELCIGAAVHESWNIPWSAILFLKSTDKDKYKIYETNEKNYLDSVKERIEFLKKAFPDKKEEIESSIPLKYQGMTQELFGKVIDDILFPLYLNKNELQKDNLSFFGVEINVVKKNKLIPMEIAILDK